VALGAALFVIGAAALVSVRGTALSAEARQLAERLLELVRGGPWWRSWLLVAVLPAVGEEVFFRGWLLSACSGARPARGRAVAAVAAQAAAFAAFHLLPERLPQTFALGLVLGWMTLRSRSILPAIVAHAAHNSAPLVLVAFAAEPMVAGGTVPVTIVAVAVGCLAVGAAIFAAATPGRGATGQCNDVA
jgi:membrane protease YdiL (CAAX protease family)